MARSFKRYVVIQDFTRSIKAEGCDALTGTVGVTCQCAAVASHGVDGSLWRGLRSAIRPDWAVHCFWLYGPVDM
jgi:hypothetical protein